MRSAQKEMKYIVEIDRQRIGFCINNDELYIQMMSFVFKMMIFVLKLMICELKMMMFCISNDGF